MQFSMQQNNDAYQQIQIYVSLFTIHKTHAISIKFILSSEYLSGLS